MNRRPMLRATATARISAADGKPKSPFIVPEGKTLSETMLNTGGNAMRLLLRTSDTDNHCTILENITDPGGGPPLHVHEREDEWFYIVDGEYAIQVGDKIHRLKPGASAFGPRNVPHAFQCLSAQPGRMLTVFDPGGIEGFFIEMTRLGHPTEELTARYGMKVVGPPLHEKKA